MRMLAYHGGLTPPALGGSAVRTLPAKLRPVRYTNARLQERRASPRCACSTVYAIESPNHRQSRTHATPKSGGRQPAVVRESHRQRRACLSERETDVAQLAYARHSWSRERVPLLICVSDRRVRYVCPGRLTPTALGARRYVPSGISAICTAQTHMHKSGERQPAVVRVTHRQRRACLSERETDVAQLAYARHSWSRERVPLLICVSDRRVCYVCPGRLTPTALGARRYVPSGNSAICAARTHMHKSGERQPAAVRYRTGNTERFLPNEDARMPRGAYAPRSWWFCSADICRRNCDLCDTRTLTYKSGGRQPAVVRVTHRQHRAFLTE
jgi:hypothetical protein